MNYSFHKPNRTKYVLGCGYLILFLIPLFMTAYDLSVPGLYYDEAIQAVPAMEFLDNNRQPWDFPGNKSIEILKRPFPYMTQDYMGALKSQVLIPVFALFGPSNASLRTATLIIALIGLLVAMVWAYKNFGLPTALISGLFIVFDPSFLFISRHDWGSFALGFLCRCCSLLFITNGWKKQSRWQFFAAGCFLGLGMYNKMDFSIFIIAAAMALVISSLKSVATELRSRLKEIAFGMSGFVLCTLPLLLSIEWTTFKSPAGHPDEWIEKLYVIITMLNGSYFHRLMLSGGVFESMFDVREAAAGFFLIIFVCSVIMLGAVLLINKRKGTPNAGHTFVFFVTIFTMVGFFLLPGTARIHHMMNAYPFPHLLVVIAAAQLFKTANKMQKHFRRAAAASLIILVLAGNLYVDARTLLTINRTGGKGRWSEALHLFADELKNTSDAVVVSLDWGFHGQLSFANVPATLLEPIWIMPQIQRQSAELIFTGTPQHIYLIYEPKYAYFPYRIPFLNAIHSLPPNLVTVDRHNDRQGDPAFISVRISRPHRIIYNGSFQISIEQ